MSEKMTNKLLRETVARLNDLTNNEYIINSFDMGDTDRTTYGMFKKNKDGTMDMVLDAKYSKRDIYYHIQGFILFSKQTVSTAVKPSAKKTKKGDDENE